MEKFSEIVAKNHGRRNIVLKVGRVRTYISKNSNILKEMTKERIEWLDNHKILKEWSGLEEIELIYKGSKKYEKMVWG